MRIASVFLFLLLLAGCGGGSSAKFGLGGTQAQPGGGGATPAGTLRLALSVEPDGADYRVLLSAPAAADLYQLAGTLRFDSARYELVRTEAGGGLGGPEDCLFSGRETAAGCVGFAYTKRYHGAGANGRLQLLCVTVHPLGTFRQNDFSLEQGAGKLKARNSHKQDFACVLEVVQ